MTCKSSYVGYCCDLGNYHLGPALLYTSLVSSLFFLFFFFFFFNNVSALLPSSDDAELSNVMTAHQRETELYIYKASRFFQDTLIRQIDESIRIKKSLTESTCNLT